MNTCTIVKNISDINTKLQSDVNVVIKLLTANIDKSGVEDLDISVISQRLQMLIYQI